MSVLGTVMAVIEDGEGRPEGSTDYLSPDRPKSLSQVSCVVHACNNRFTSCADNNTKPNQFDRPGCQLRCSQRSQRGFRVLLKALTATEMTAAAVDFSECRDCTTHKPTSAWSWSQTTNGRAVPPRKRLSESIRRAIARPSGSRSPDKR